MKVTLRYFAAVREAIGESTETREIAPGSTAGSLMDALARDYAIVAGARRSIMVMVNQVYAEPAQPLRDGDEVALIPPVSGGESTSAALSPPLRVQPEPLDPRTVEDAVAAGEAGAIVTFTGTVRDNARGRSVIALEYEAYPAAAERMFGQIRDEIVEQWGIGRVAIVHRIGRLAVGEASVVIAVASPHRGEAFAACQYTIDRLKQIVPIWKKEVYADGTSWIGSEADYRRELASSAPTSDCDQ